MSGEPNKIGAPRRVLGSVLTVALLVGFLWTLFPARFGGYVSLVVVQGNSMEPTFHSGDLIYVRTTDAYEVGDIAVYRYRESGADTDAASNRMLIVHRIVSDTDGIYRFQGDNRDSMDSSDVRPGDLVGRPVANLGPIPVQVLARIPLLMAIVIGIAVVYLLWPSKPEDYSDESNDDSDSNSQGEPQNSSEAGAHEVLALAG